MAGELSGTAAAAAGPIPITPATPASVSSARRGQIDALRAIAVAWVLIDHYSPAGHGPVGWLSVSLFLMISGYLITQILLRGRDAAEASGKTRRRLIGHFYARRMLRIAPAYALAVLATFAVHAPEFEGTLAWHLTFQSSVLYALTNEWGPPWQLAHIWTLSVQEQFYLLWPLVMVTTPRRYLPLAVLAFGLLGPLYRGLIWTSGHGEEVVAFTLLPASMTAICLGASAAMLERRGLEPSWFAGPRPWWLLAALAVFVSLGVADPPGGGWRYLVLDFVWLVPLAALLMSASLGMQGPVGWLLEQGWLQYLGRISLGIYLYQFLGFELAAWLLQQGGLFYGKGPMLTVLSLLVTVTMAHLSWTLMERRMNGLKRHFPYR